METNNEMKATIVRPAVTGWSLVGMDDPVQGTVFPLPAKSIIGRDEQCDIVLDSPLVSRRHAELEITNDGLLVCDLGSTNGTFVADEKVNRIVVTPGTEIRFDVLRFRLQGPQPDNNTTQFRPVVDSAPSSHLEENDTTSHLEEREAAYLVGTGDFAANRFDLNQDQVYIGRGEDNDIVLDDPTVSTRHASLVASEDGWYVEDNDSSNGTFVGDRQVTRQLLSHGESIRFGTLKLHYENPGDKDSDATGLLSLQKDETRTSMTPIVSTNSPWIWGVGSFLVVVVIMSIVYLFLR